MPLFSPAENPGIFTAPLAQDLFSFSALSSQGWLASTSTPADFGRRPATAHKKPLSSIGVGVASHAAAFRAAIAFA